MAFELEHLCVLVWLFLQSCAIVSCYKEARHMNETLRLLYDRFYTPLPMAESEQEVETCHRQLIERLDKPERKLVLRIIDAQNLMIEQRSVDSLICGFRLAWEMANELNHYMEERPEPENDLGPDALA